jgi:hypothetical protein
MNTKLKEMNMQSFEYKVVKVPIKGIFKRDISPDFDNILNAEGKEGWKLVNSVVPASGFGESDQVVLIFIREIN